MSTIHALITGRPGAGKTTVVKRTCDLLLQHGYAVCGFYTEEVRQNRVRVGFDVVSLAGGRTVLARTDQAEPGGSGGGPSRRTGPYVGQYRVDIKSFEDATMASLSHRNAPNSITVIDEIGKMELKSVTFGEEVRRIFADPCSVVLATVPATSGSSDALPLIRELLRRPDIRLFKVTRDNRDAMADELALFLKVALTSK